jgi:putative phosphoesterase
MRIGIISDTHDHVARTGRAVAMLLANGAEALLHCGDLTGPEIVHECGLLPSYYVFGNNDFDELGLRRAIAAVDGTCLGEGGEVVLAGKRIAIAHGDVPGVIRRLAAASPDYFLFGHSHIPTDDRDGPTRWVNPGALHRASDWTVAVLDLETDDLRFLTVR